MGMQHIIHGPVTEIPQDSLGKQLHERLQQYRNLPAALIDADTKETLSYNTILEKTCRLAESLRNLGIKQDDVIAIFSENSLEFIYPLISTLYIGCTLTTFNAQYMAGEILHAANISNPTVIFCSEMTVDSLLEVKHRIKSLKKIVILHAEERREGCESLEEFISNNSKENCDPINFKPTDVDVNNQVAFILYSSGTTGLPKGVMLTQRNVNAVLSLGRNPVYAKDCEPGTDVVMGLLPFFHAYGLHALIFCIVLAKQLVVLKAFDPEVFLQTIEDYKIASVFLVPALANFLAKSPLVDQYDLSSIQLVACGAAPLSKETENLLIKRLKLEIFRQGYGMTETTLGVLGFPIEEQRPGSCGKILPNTSAKVVDTETGEILGPGKMGELCFKGDMIMKGYIGNVEATQTVIREDGWLYTGDVGYYDEDGFFYIVDRAKELIKYNSFQVPPAELEAVLLTHPKIVDAGAVGLPDEIAGELPVAFVVTEPGETLTEKEVQDFVSKQVSPPKRLRGGVRFVDEIPRNASGKILRKVLRELLINPKSKL